MIRGERVTGLEIFFTIIFSIVALIVIILSIPLKVSFSYSDKLYLSVKYLFIKINFLPTDPNKPKKEKKPAEKKEEPQKEKPAEPKEKKPNPILELLKSNGHDGMIEILQKFGNILKTYGGKLFKSIVFDEAYIDISVGTGDAASTAVKYGKTCQIVYPLMGFICNNNVVKKYDANVEADFLANDTVGEFSFVMSVCIRKIINSTLGFAVRLIFGVVLKFLSGGLSNKSSAKTENTKETTTAPAVKNMK